MSALAALATLTAIARRDTQETVDALARLDQQHAEWERKRPGCAQAACESNCPGVREIGETHCPACRAPIAPGSCVLDAKRRGNGWIDIVRASCPCGETTDFEVTN